MTHEDPPRRAASVVVLCEHALLGEGLAARLTDIGFLARVVLRFDVAAVATALATLPDVVIAEGTQGCREQVAALTPRSRIVDIGNVVGRGYPTAEDRVSFETILGALGE